MEGNQNRKRKQPYILDKANNYFFFILIFDIIINSQSKIKKQSYVRAGGIKRGFLRS